MGVLDRLSYVRGGSTGYNGSGPAPGVSPDIGLSASFGVNSSQGGSGDASIQATGILLIVLAAIVFVAARGMR
jgi:hypothetical protein